MSRPPEIETSQVTLDHFIRIYPMLPSELCDRIIERAEGADNWEELKVGEESDYYRDSSQIWLEEFPALCEEVLGYLRKEVFNYSNDFFRATQEMKGFTSIRVLKYGEGQRVKEHSDAGMQARQITIAIPLNDEYEGGQFSFWDKEVIYTIPKGSGIMFPANFVFPHEVLPVSKGTRYSLLTWITCGNG